MFVDADVDAAADVILESLRRQLLATGVAENRKVVPEPDRSRASVAAEPFRTRCLSGFFGPPLPSQL